MNVSVDAVLSYHLNGATCGVARFNKQLAERIGVRLGSLEDCDAGYPLISIKPTEINGWVKVQAPRFDLFLHCSMPASWGGQLVMDATRVYAANPVIAEDLRAIRQDIIGAFCPSTIQGNPHRSALNVLTFGMAHKLNAPHYEKLKGLLDSGLRLYGQRVHGNPLRVAMVRSG